ncbi:hypothetical protein [Microbacterium sp. Leaf320]|uniref:hypothetical protein n=1 Tax=Microbacterium sp. Leaf320 TaxID=1736334 RepID=UPI0006F9A0D9|nr:hypothetical protein [Microbacterium sp. Leaf320]KQQ65196.1 hypothetical protein ASF63_14660 [Microbacterium sp. Leaf320]
MEGRISLLVDSPLRDLAIAYRTVPAEVRRQNNKAVKAAAQPIWKAETAERAVTKIQHRTLVDTAKVGVTNRNVFLRAGGNGTLKSGTAIAALQSAAEFGRPAAAPIKSRSKKPNSKPYTRTTGSLFGDRNRRGKVVFPAARDSIRRFASLQIQTTLRTLHEAGEKVR